MGIGGEFMFVCSNETFCHWIVLYLYEETSEVGVLR